MAETNGSAIPPYAVRVVSGEASWTVWPGAPEGVRLQVHGVAGEVLEVALAPADGTDQLTLRAYRLRPEGSGWVELYDGPVVPLQAVPDADALMGRQNRRPPAKKGK